MTVQVRWHSALPVRQAIAKIRFGAEVATSPEAAKLLAEQRQYIIGISGLPPQMLRVKPEQMKPGVELRIKDKPPIAVANIQGDQDQGGRANIYLIFPKTPETAIKLEDTEVELVAKLGPVEVKRKFRLKDMVFDGKLEL